MTSDAGREIRDEDGMGLGRRLRALAVARAVAVVGHRRQGGCLRGAPPAARGDRVLRGVDAAVAILDDLDVKNTHHENGVKWDNRPSNIEAIDHGEHAATASETSTPDTGRDVEVLADD